MSRLEGFPYLVRFRPSGPTLVFSLAAGGVDSGSVCCQLHLSGTSRQVVFKQLFTQTVVTKRCVPTYLCMQGLPSSPWRQGSQVGQRSLPILRSQGLCRSQQAVTAGTALSH